MTTDAINRAMEEAKKHFIMKPYMLICSKEDYFDVKDIVKKEFPQIKAVIWHQCVPRGHIYLFEDDKACYVRGGKANETID